MNRKMRAKLNNQAAKAAKERRASCPQAGKLVVTSPEQYHCDKCGDELVPVLAALVENVPDKSHLH